MRKFRHSCCFAPSFPFSLFFDMIRVGDAIAQIVVGNSNEEDEGRESTTPEGVQSANKFLIERDEAELSRKTSDK